MLLVLFQYIVAIDIVCLYQTQYTMHSTSAFFPHDNGPNLIKHSTSTWPLSIWSLILMFELMLLHLVLQLSLAPT